MSSRAKDIDISHSRILIAEDDVALADELRIALEDYGMSPRVAVTWDQLSALLKAELPEILLLDQRLGEIDAVTKIPSIKAMGVLRVIVLTGNHREVDRIVALEIGADDFLLKPISCREVVARIRAHLRNLHPAEAKFGNGWVFSLDSRSLKRPDGGEVILTAAEFDLLAVFVARRGEAVDRRVLTQEVLRRPWQPNDRALDNLVMRLRQKFGNGGDRAIQSVRNAGYLFAGFPEN
ncbi:response regulator transcription factor [Roseomonas sp. USHLN139]|uniref:response regulator transcription factor n=1 Tax=Roseomonas sp. USHLN139 TaxID=3081298 RepID=UPI003B01E6E2